MLLNYLRLINTGKENSNCMKKITLDILDKEFNDWSSMNFDKRKRNYQESILLDVKNWEDYYSKLSAYNFVWSEFKYDTIDNTSKLNTIIDKDYTGIYMFIIKPNNLIYDCPKNVLYIGISGENNKNRPLRERIKDYFQYSKLKKRDAVMRLLGKYYPNVYVAYTYCDKSTTILKEIESNLIGFFYPLCNKDDFPIELKPEKQAF